MSEQIEALRRFMADRVQPPTASHVVVLGSGKGGVGTSTLAALLALVTSVDARVLLVDADASLGSLHLLLGAPQGPGLGALRGGRLETSDLLVPVTETLALLPGGGAPELTAAERQALFRRASSLYDNFDLVVVDGGSRLESVLVACGSGVRTLLAVTTADRVSVAATYALVKTVGARFPGTPVQLLVNREDSGGAARVAEEVRTASRRFLKRDVGFRGSVPEDPCLRAGIQAGMLVQEAATDSPAAAAVQALGSTLLPQLTAGSPALGGRYPLHWRS